MNDLGAILSRYRTGPTLGAGEDESPVAPRLGRDLEVGLARIGRRATASYAVVGTFAAALLGVFASTPGKQPLLVVALVSGAVLTADYLRRVSRERDAMNLVLGLCRTADEPVIAAVVAGAYPPAVRAASEPRRVLPFEEVEHLHGAAVRGGLGSSRSALFGGLDPALLSSLPVYASPSGQLLSDIHELNRLGGSAGGDAPLRTWLRNAKLLAGPRPAERATIDRCLSLLGSPPLRAAGAPS